MESGLAKSGLSATQAKYFVVELAGVITAKIYDEIAALIEGGMAEKRLSTRLDASTERSSKPRCRRHAPTASSRRLKADVCDHEHSAKLAMERAFPGVVATTQD